MLTKDPSGWKLSDGSHILPRRRNPLRTVGSRAGETFRYSEAGPRGLLGGRRVIVVEARGGLYSDGSARTMDFQEHYLRQLFAFVGITDVMFVRAEKLSFGPEVREAAIAAARRDLEQLITTQRKRAA